MTEARDLLVFTACYNERGNIAPLVEAIFAAVPAADLLVLDDSSPDGTWDAVQTLRARHPRLHAVQRPRKMGVGSAHRYALLHAMRQGYRTLVTLDADFSHDPAAIPALLAAHAPGRMVIGSRYCPGGSCDYTGYRAWVSRLGNAVARRALGLPLRELTTYFRVIDVATLHHLPLHRLDAEGYGYGVQLIQALHRAGVALVEVPIRFADRTRGASKIPKLQILWSALGLARLALERLAPRRAAPVGWTEAACQGCGDHALVARRGPRVARRLQGSSAAPSHHCLRCGLRQTPPAPSCPPQRPDR